MKSWPHAPARIASGPGLYFVTGSTLHKTKHFNTDQKLDLLEDQLLTIADEYGWMLQAWAVFQNHYHFVGIAPDEGANFRKFLGKLHTLTARDLNRMDNTPGRTVWFNFRDTQLTNTASYLARLAYVHRNAVHHGLAISPEMYPWCSAEWFKQKADPAFFNTVNSFKTDKLNIEDDF